MWLVLKRTVCFLRRVGNHSRRAAKDAASRNEFAYRLAPSFYVEMDAISTEWRSLGTSRDASKETPLRTGHSATRHARCRSHDASSARSRLGCADSQPYDRAVATLK